MIILAIETSCDDTCAAVLENDRILSNIVSSQTDLHAKWGGVVPDIAKRAHMENIMPVIAESFKRGFKMRAMNKVDDYIEAGMKKIDVIAVTQGPGLAIALGVGVNTAKELAIKYNKKLIAVNHIEGHMLVNLAKNSAGKPERKIVYPILALTVSGGHTKIVLINDIGKYTVIGETLDDAAGEALDKAAKMMGLGYPGGPIVERLALRGNSNFMELPRPLADKKILDYSFSGLKTSFYYKIKDWPKEKIASNLCDLSASYQRAVFDTLIRKYKLAIEKYQPKTLIASGGVVSNMALRKDLRRLAKTFGLPIFMPFNKILNTDNAAMIGVAGYYKALRNEFVDKIEELDRNPRLTL